MTPEQGVKAIKTGIYPEIEDLEKSQERYIEKRKEGMYNPLVDRGVLRGINFYSTRDSG